MLKTIEQSVRFSSTSQELYDIYIDPKRHAEVTGGEVKISSKPGSKFRAFDGALTGGMLYTVPGQLVVQRWRSKMFFDDDHDSILILRFVQEAKRGRIDLVHANVPKQDNLGVSQGWEKYYWRPLRVYLKKLASKR
jgi:activator of HSP90 ATPase